MRIELAGQTTLGGYSRLIWEDGEVTSPSQAVLTAYRAAEDAWKGQPVKMPETGVIVADQKTPWGFYAIAVSVFAHFPDIVDGELPTIIDPEDTGANDSPVIY